MYVEDRSISFAASSQNDLETRLALVSVLGPFGVHWSTDFCISVHSYAVHFIVPLSTL